MKTQYILLAIGLLVGQIVQLTPAAAYGCLKARTQYELLDDDVEWSIATPAHRDCIQSVQSSGKRVLSVAVMSLPAKGRVFLSGPSFRYVADTPGAVEMDEFDLLVLGRAGNREGFSTIRVKVNPDEVQLHQVAMNVGRAASIETDDTQDIQGFERRLPAVEPSVLLQLLPRTDHGATNGLQCVATLKGLLSGKGARDNAEELYHERWPAGPVKYSIAFSEQLIQLAL
jgi:hypothetical protein